MVFSFQGPEYMFWPLGALITGFILAQTGTHYLNQYVRPDRPDVSLTTALKGFSDNYALYHYVTPAMHVLLAPEACYVFLVKMQGGKIIIKDGRGNEPLTLWRIITYFGREPIGDLAREAQLEADKLTGYLAKRLPNVQVPVTPVVVFAFPDAQLDVHSSTVPVVHAKQLKDWLRGPGKAKGISPATREQLAAVLGGAGIGEAA
jgi:hypothetical protein